MERELLLQIADQLNPKDYNDILLKEHIVKIAKKEILPELSDTYATLVVSALGLVIGASRNRHLKEGLETVFY